MQAANWGLHIQFLKFETTLWSCVGEALNNILLRNFLLYSYLTPLWNFYALCLFPLTGNENNRRVIELYRTPQTEQH